MSERLRGARVPYFGAIDGLRAISVIAVLCYHAGASWMPGGFLGVDVFFVISGYLITSLLLGEWQDSRGISLRRFWMRRARRLLPELFLVLAAVLTYTAIVHRSELTDVRADALASAGYVMNWWLIFGEQSYFDTWGRPPVLRHLWSLAVEEQFYLAWPLVTVGVLRLFGRKVAVFGVALVGALGSAALMAYLYQSHEPGDDLSRLYYGTDTRASAVLIGSALAVAWTPWANARGPWQHRLATPASHCAIAVSTAALIACFVFAKDDSAFLYRGGFLGVALVTAVLIAAVVHPAAKLATPAFGNSPLRWLGERSYGIYLWHWPIFAYTGPGDVDFDGPALVALRFGATIVLADLSYRLVAAPIRGGALRRGWRTLHAPQTRQEWSLRPVAMLAVAVLAGGATFIAIEPTHSADLPTSFTGIVAPVATPTLPPASATMPVSATPGTLQTPAASETATEEPAATSTAAAPLPVLPPANISADVLAIGDSVMLGATSTLGLAGAVQVDAAVGRQPSSVPEIIDAYRSVGSLPPVLVVHVGSNGAFTRRDFDKIVEAAAGVHQIVFVNVHVDRSWEKSNNAMLAGAVGSYSITSLVDWKGASEGHGELFASDGVHLTWEGADLYARMIAAAIIPPPDPTPTPEPPAPTPEPETPTPEPTATPEDPPPEPTPTEPPATADPTETPEPEETPIPEDTATPEPATPTDPAGPETTEQVASVTAEASTPQAEASDDASPQVPATPPAGIE